MHTLTSPSGLRFELLANGSLHRAFHGEIMLNLFPGNETEGSPTNLFLHVEGSAPVALIGPSSPSSTALHEQFARYSGHTHGIQYTLTLRLAEDQPAWFWLLELENTSPAPITTSLVVFHDIAVATYGAIRLNEYYVSQYIDHQPLAHPHHGHMILSRQNQPMAAQHPATLIGSFGRAVGFATDALDAAIPLGHTRTQGEHSMVGLQDAPITLAPGEKTTRGFFGLFIPDKPEATTEADVSLADGLSPFHEAAVPSFTLSTDIGLVYHPIGDEHTDQSRRHSLGPLESLAAGEVDDCRGDERADASQRFFSAAQSLVGWAKAKGFPVEKPSLPAPTLFTTAPHFPSEDLTNTELDHFGPSRLHEETDGPTLLSFFTPQHHHVVLRAKEKLVLRPHGHILRTGSATTPDEAALTSTAWMDGCFHSMVTQGHVSINRLLSTTHSYLGLFSSHGQRIFVEHEGKRHLLAMPSAFLIAPDHCRWLYKNADSLIEITSTAPEANHALHLRIRILAGSPARFLISHHIAIHGDDGNTRTPLNPTIAPGSITIATAPGNDLGHRFPNGSFTIHHDAIETIGDDSFLHADGRSRGEPFICLHTAAVSDWTMHFTANLTPQETPTSQGFWARFAHAHSLTPPANSPLAPAIAHTASILPWFVHNAFVHYLSPRGLEQYSGGGWGTRDVCQGAFELLAAFGEFAAQRDLLTRVLRQQNPDGDWPQWFMFFERERNIRPGDSHGDIVFWPVLAIAQYLLATGDASFLENEIPFFTGELATVQEHIDRALALISARTIPGSHLAAYGHGDWNDSLQPARPDMREHLCSAWTVTLHYQTLTTLARAYHELALPRQASELDRAATTILAEFHDSLIINSTTAGYAYFHPSGQTQYLLHPSDTLTGIRYSALPMIHGILNDLYTPEEAAHHLALIREHLHGPDGAHLFDRPITYHGGTSTTFQRAETASYFGREIGLMYMHAHLRFAEALARLGEADEFFAALCRANPIAVQQLVPSACLRQANCYYSSSDPAFPDRYLAQDHYDAAVQGNVPLEGGWRIYSSGAGIATRLIIQHLLGITIGADHLLIDPVIPPSLNGLTATLDIAGTPTRITYHIGAKGAGVSSISHGETPIPFTREPNPYRPGPARIPLPIPASLTIAVG